MSQTITKSIRLSPAESAEIAQLSETSAVSEAALLKQWVLRGVQEHKIGLAVQAYMNEQVDIRGGAPMADISYNQFLRELENRRVLILGDDGLLERLAGLATIFADDGLLAAVEAVAQESAPPIGA